jgi:hypothetical protein
MPIACSRLRPTSTWGGGKRGRSGQRGLRGGRAAPGARHPAGRAALKAVAAPSFQGSRRLHRGSCTSPGPSPLPASGWRGSRRPHACRGRRWRRRAPAPGARGSRGTRPARRPGRLARGDGRVRGGAQGKVRRGVGQAGAAAAAGEGGAGGCSRGQPAPRATLLQPPAPKARTLPTCKRAVALEAPRQPLRALLHVGRALVGHKRPQVLRTARRHKRVALDLRGGAAGGRGVPGRPARGASSTVRRPLLQPLHLPPSHASPHPTPPHPTPPHPTPPHPTPPHPTPPPAPAPPGRPPWRTCRTPPPPSPPRPWPSCPPAGSRA